MSHNNKIKDNDTVFMIDPDTGAITNVSPIKKINQNNHNSERFTFVIPRYVEGHDMLECNVIEVHYVNISSDGEQKSEGVYLITDAKVSPDSEDTVILSWLLTRNSTRYEGALSFLIRFTCQTGGEVDYEWNTDIYEGIAIGKGMNNGEAVIAKYADVLATWKTETLSEVTTLVNEIGDNFVYARSSNLLNPETITEGKTIDDTGAVVDSDTYSLTDYIEVKRYEQFVFSYESTAGYRSSSSQIIHFFDEEKNYISSYTSTLVDMTSAPATGYARFSILAKALKAEKKPCIKVYTDPTKEYEEYYEGYKLKVKGYPVGFERTEYIEKLNQLEGDLSFLNENMIGGYWAYGSANIFDNDFSGTGYYNDGVRANSDRYKCTPSPVPIRKVVDTLYAIITETANPLSLQFLDESGAYVGCHILSNKTTDTIPVPEGATHFVMYLPVAWAGKICFSYEQIAEYVDYGGYNYTRYIKEKEADKTLTEDGGYADAKAVGDKFKQFEEDVAIAVENASRIGVEETSGNLFDGTWADGWFSTANGAEGTVAGYRITAYIPFSLKDEYSNSLNVKTSIASKRLTFAVYDEAKTFIKAAYTTLAELSICDLPENGYVRFMIPNTEEFDLYVGQEPFNSYERVSTTRIAKEQLSTSIQNTFRMIEGLNIVEKTHGNIFDNVYGSGGYIQDGKDNFNLYNNTFHRTAKYYPFKKGALYMAAQTSTQIPVYLYDQNKEFVETIYFSSAKTVMLDYDGYFRLYVPITNTALIYISNEQPGAEVDYTYYGTTPSLEAGAGAGSASDFAGEVCVCFGDSIMAGDTDRPWTSIPYVIGEKSGMITYNAGFGGTRMADRGTATPAQVAFNAFSFCHLVEAVISGDFSTQETALSNSEVAAMRYFDEHLATLKSIDFSTVDRVTIAYGTNDYTSEYNAISSDDDLDISTVCGALKYSVKKLQEAFPHLKILVITPIWGYYDFERMRSGDDINHGFGTLPEYVEGIMETSKKLKLPCLDAYYQLGFNFYNAEYYFNGGADNVHLNERGRERYADLIYRKIKSTY